MTSRRLGLVGTWSLGSLGFHRVRTVLTAAGIAFAACLVSSSLGFQNGAETALERNIEAMGYQVLVTGKGCPHEAATLILRGGSIPMYIRDEVYREIVDRPEVADATRFLLQSTPQPDGRSHQLVVGVDDGFLRLKPGVEFQRGDWFSSGLADEAILGFSVAEYLRLDLGDTVAVQGRPLAVRGILHKLGTQDDGTIFLPLAVAQEAFERGGKVTGIGLRVHDSRSIGDLVESIYDIPSVQVVRMSQVQSRLLDALHGFRGLLAAIAGMAMIVACLGVVTTALLAAHERTSEMGLLRALGCSTTRLFFLVLGETAFVSLAGSLVGIAAAFALRDRIGSWLRTNTGYIPSGEVIALTPGLVVATTAIVVMLCVLAAVYPALRACRIPPSRTLRGGLR